MASRVKEAAGTAERILLPRLNSIDGELKTINTRIDSSTNELRSEIKAVDTKVSEMDKRLAAKIDSISEKVDTVRDIERLKVKVAELEKRR